MKCHYDILGVDLSCSSDDLKKAYRKLALEWHPDKNLDRLDEAKENFQLIQQAYDILSDPQERAWYDRHREDILKGDAEEAYKDDSINVYQFFNTSCFKGYNDDEKGFYTVYRQVFEKITTEDKPFMDDDEYLEVPQFGTSKSPYEDVHTFYAYWQSYCTVKSYSWVDKYDLTESRKSGVGRLILRAMEKENKKLRDAQKKIRNEEIRELVSFVRKRDKRVQAQKKLMEEKKAEKAKKANEKRRQLIEERNKVFENYEETEWSSLSKYEDHFNEIEAVLDEKFGGAAEANAEEDGNSDLYCIACEKDFRSEKSFKNHENSKKHKENVALLKALMEEEDEALQGNKNISDSDEQIEISTEKENIEDSRADVEENEEESDQEENVSSEAMLDDLIKSSTKSKKKKKKSKAPSCVTEIIETTKNEIEQTVGDIQDSLEAVELVEDHLATKNSVNPLEADAAASNSSLKITKKKVKKSKPNAVKKETSDAAAENDESEKPTTICGTCSNEFPSRNKLFEHIKSTGHAMIKAEKACTSGTGKKKGKRKQ